MRRRTGGGPAARARIDVEFGGPSRGAAPSAEGLRRFLLGVARCAGGKSDRASVAVAFVSDRRMRELNRRYRAVDSTTDVLAFPSGERRPEGGVHLGDLAISLPAAARQARERGHSLARELRVLLLHGYLHLLGHDHEKDRGQMRRLESRLLRELLPRRRARRAP